MKRENLLENLLSNPDIKMTDMQKGLTNNNFLLEINQSFYVFRVPHIDSETIVHRQHETMALKAIEDANLDVETVYYDEVSGYKVTRYIADAKSYAECDYPDKLERTAALMKYFHNLNKTIDADFNPIARLLHYQKLIKTPLFDLKPFTYVLDEVTNMQYKKILCHNDWVDGNILFTKDRTYLIDYEYAANNDPLFDVMSFITENKILDQTQRERFYKIYFDKMDDTIRKNLLIWEKFHNLLWCNWSMMMWENRHEEIYKNIAYDKYQAMLQMHPNKINQIIVDSK